MGWVTKVSNKGGDFEKPPVGNHPAVLVAIIDMGTQEQEYLNQTKSLPRAYFIWELVDAKMSGTKDVNHVIAIDLTVSLNKKAKLRQWIESRVNKQMPEDFEYDITKELGQKCMLDVIANKKGYPVVNGMKSVPAKLSFSPAQRSPVFISLDDFREKGESILPEWTPYCYGEPLADIINRCHEITGKGGAKDEETVPYGNPNGSAVDADPDPF